MLLVALAGLVFLAGCHDDSSSVSQQPTATLQSAPRKTTSTSAESTTTATTKPPSVKDQVEAAYLKAEAAYGDAMRDPNPDDARVAATTEGPSLEKTRANLAALRKAGLRVEYRDNKTSVPTILKVELKGPMLATVTSCLVADGRQVRVSDGKVVDDKVASRLNRAEMSLRSGVWRLHSLTRLKRWADDRGCER